MSAGGGHIVGGCVALVGEQSSAIATWNVNHTVTAYSDDNADQPSHHSRPKNNSYDICLDHYLRIIKSYMRNKGLRKEKPKGRNTLKALMNIE